MSLEFVGKRFYKLKLNLHMVIQTMPWLSVSNHAHTVDMAIKFILNIAIPHMCNRSVALVNSIDCVWVSVLLHPHKLSKTLFLKKKRHTEEVLILLIVARSKI